MKFIDKLEILLHIIDLINDGNTCSVTKIGESLNLSGRTVLKYINELRAMGAVIEWDKNNNTYVNKNEFNIFFKINKVF